MSARKQVAPLVPYQPATWNDQQRALHEPASLDEALHHASALAGGWYQAPCVIYYRVTEANTEAYQVRPDDAPAPAGWTACYRVEALR